MDCFDTKAGLLEQIYQKAIIHNIPIVAALELTYQCHLHCKHCYIEKRHNKILTTKQWYAVIDALQSLGTLKLLLTGGEIFLRSDIFNILAYARKKYFQIEIISSLTTLTEEDIQKLKHIGISHIRTSLYSYTPQIHDEFVMLPGAWQKTIDAIRLLRENNISIEVQTILMTINIHEILALKRKVESLGAHFSWTMDMQPSEQGNGYPLDYRLTNDLVEQYLVTNKDYQKSLHLHAMITHKKNKQLPLCNAGISSLAVDAHGHILPCLGWPMSTMNVLEDDLDKVWHTDNVFQNLREISKGNHSCRSCEHFNYCQPCLAMNKLMNNDVTVVHEDSCFVAKSLSKIL